MNELGVINLGLFLLATSWILSLYGFISGSFAAYSRATKLAHSALNSFYLCVVFVWLSLITLAVLFLTHRFEYRYVWQTSNLEMEWYYLISAIWGGMDGSMLLWAAIMLLFSGLTLRSMSTTAPIPLVRCMVPVLSFANGFFITVVLFFTNPFRFVPSSRIPMDGNGMNPLLQNPSMLLHPPLLYAGLTGFVVPFAFCIAALLSANLSNQWIYLTRRWTLIAWGFLTAGIILGGNWAYIELGWGGFWAWDPVENASFLPWLTATAFLHSVMVQERRGMLKLWNVCLSVGTYLLTVFGTFLTRSGIVQSVHSFAESDVGWLFLLYMGIVAAVTFFLILMRLKDLRPERKLESYLSREALFLFNNLIFISICFATFWGVMFPVISEALTGQKSVVGPPFFNQVNVPLFLILLFLMGVGPQVSWRSMSWIGLKESFLGPFLIGMVVSCIFVLVDSSRIYAAIAFGLSVFVLGAIEGEFRRGLKAQRAITGKNLVQDASNLIRRRSRRYGGFIVHLGIAVMAISITASSAYKIEKDLNLKIGQSVSLGRYVLELIDLKQAELKNYSVVTAKVAVFSADRKELLGELNPERRFYPRNQETTTEVDIRVTPRDDLYLALAAVDFEEATDSQQNMSSAVAVFKAFVNPLQLWLWFGSIIVLVGTVVVLIPQMKTVTTFSEQLAKVVPTY